MPEVAPLGTSGISDIQPQSKVQGTRIANPASAGFTMLEPGASVYQTSYGYLIVSPSGEQTALSPSRNVIRQPTELTNVRTTAVSQVAGTGGTFASEGKPRETGETTKVVSTPTGAFEVKSDVYGNIIRAGAAVTPEPTRTTQQFNQFLTPSEIKTMKETQAGQLIPFSQASLQKGMLESKTAQFGSTEFYEGAATQYKATTGAGLNLPENIIVPQTGFKSGQDQLNYLQNLANKNAGVTYEYGGIPFAEGLTPSNISEKILKDIQARKMEETTLRESFGFKPYDLKFLEGTVQAKELTKAYQEGLPRFQVQKGHIIETYAYNPNIVLKDWFGGKVEVKPGMRYMRDIFGISTELPMITTAPKVTEEQARLVRFGEEAGMFGATSGEFFVTRSALMGATAIKASDFGIISRALNLVGTKTKSQFIGSTELMFGKGTLGDIARSIYPIEGTIKTPFGKPGLIGESFRTISPVKEGTPFTYETIFGRGSSIGDIARGIYPAEGTVKAPFGRVGLIGESARSISPVTEGTPFTMETVFGRGSTIGDIARGIYPAEGTLRTPFGTSGLIGETARGISPVTQGIPFTYETVFGKGDLGLSAIIKKYGTVSKEPFPTVGEIARGISPVKEGKPVTFESFFGKGNIKEQLGLLPKSDIALMRGEAYNIASDLSKGKPDVLDIIPPHSPTKAETKLQQNQAREMAQNVAKEMQSRGFEVEARGTKIFQKGKPSDVVADINYFDKAKVDMYNLPYSNLNLDRFDLYPNIATSGQYKFGGTPGDIGILGKYYGNNFIDTSLMGIDVPGVTGQSAEQLRLLALTRQAYKADLPNWQASSATKYNKAWSQQFGEVGKKKTRTQSIYGTFKPTGTKPRITGVYQKYKKTHVPTKRTTERAPKDYTEFEKSAGELFKKQSESSKLAIMGKTYAPTAGETIRAGRIQAITTKEPAPAIGGSFADMIKRVESAQTRVLEPSEMIKRVETATRSATPLGIISRTEGVLPKVLTEKQVAGQFRKQYGGQVADIGERIRSVYSPEIERVRVRERVKEAPRAGIVREKPRERTRLTPAIVRERVKEGTMESSLLSLQRTMESSFTGEKLTTLTTEKLTAKERAKEKATERARELSIEKSIERERQRERQRERELTRERTRERGRQREPEKTILFPELTREKKKRGYKPKGKETYFQTFRGTPLIAPLAGLKNMFKTSTPRYKKRRQ